MPSRMPADQIIPLPQEVAEFGRIYDDAVERLRVGQEEQERIMWPRLFTAAELWGTGTSRNTSLESTAVPWAPPVRAEGRAAYEQLQRDREIQEAERVEKLRQEHIEAEKRAGELLKSTLPEETWKQYQKTKIVHVTTDRWMYAIHEHAKTHIYKNGKLECTACFQIQGAGVPAKDRMVAEYLMIKGDEVRYLMTANITWHEQGTERGNMWMQRFADYPRYRPGDLMVNS